MTVANSLYSDVNIMLKHDRVVWSAKYAWMAECGNSQGK